MNRSISLINKLNLAFKPNVQYEELCTKIYILKNNLDDDEVLMRSLRHNYNNKQIREFLVKHREYLVKLENKYSQDIFHNNLDKFLQ